MGTSSREQVERRLALFHHVGGEVLALGSGGRGELVERDSHFFGEGEGGLRWLAVFVGVGSGGTEQLLGNIGLRCGKAMGDYRNPARRGKGLHCSRRGRAARG